MESFALQICGVLDKTVHQTRYEGERLSRQFSAIYPLADNGFDRTLYIFLEPDQNLGSIYTAPHLSLMMAKFTI